MEKIRFYGLLGLGLFVLICEPAILNADSLVHQPLFKIERNKNANIIQYDAQVRADGKLDKKHPVIVYWIRLAEQGQVKKLSWVQKRFAFGFKTRHDPETEAVTLDMVLDIGQNIRVWSKDGTYLATMKIDGKVSRLEKIYINASGKGMSTRVNYIELHGTDMNTGDIGYQRITP